MVDDSARADLQTAVLDDYAMAIGYVCIQWGLLETTFDRLMRIIMHWSHRDEVTHVLTVNIDMRSKIKILLGVGLMYKPSAEWFDELKDVCHLVENSLRPKRNRFVHDIWLSSQEPFLRRTRGTKLSKPRSDQPIQLTHYTDTPTPVAEVWAFVQEIKDALERLNGSANEYYEFKRR
jgi:hypothetical protein